MLKQGFYVVLEGADGSGKTSTMRNVARKLGKKLVELGAIQEQYASDIIVQSHHPGSTALGRHLRKLVKYPAKVDPDIEMDDLSRQLLYMVDAVNFTKVILEPSLNKHKIVLADRSSFVSALVYGLADGLSIDDIDGLFNVMTPPRMDRLYVLQCPWEIVRERMLADRPDPIGTESGGELDHYDSKPAEFMQRIGSSYAELITRTPEQTALMSRSVALGDVVHIDSSVDADVVANKITDDIIKSMQSKCIIV